ncbi:hypothetical protein HT031_002569 [Scenedesmus sp. PABB004]|nr:hypothetical protein HT031_002569 [Scenedesmus sp. PABB004]
MCRPVLGLDVGERGGEAGHRLQAKAVATSTPQDAQARAPQAPSGSSPVKAGRVGAGGLPRFWDSADDLTSPELAAMLRPRRYWAAPPALEAAASPSAPPRRSRFAAAAAE